MNSNEMLKDLANALKGNPDLPLPPVPEPSLGLGAERRDEETAGGIGRRYRLALVVRWFKSIEIISRLPGWLGDYIQGDKQTLPVNTGAAQILATSIEHIKEIRKLI